MLSEAYLGLGSNLGDRRANISRGLGALGAVSQHVLASSLYESAAAGFSGQPAFLNAVCRLWTSLSPFELMRMVTEVQSAVSSRRPFPNGPRALDIDVLVYGLTALEVPGLTVPHPRMMQREFVLRPLAEIAPGLAHPVTGETVSSALGGLSRSSLRQVGWVPASPSYRIVDYDHVWPAAFEREKRLILSSGLVDESAVVHIGSTSVSGLGAKPKVDIMVGVPAGESYDELIDVLQGIGYEHRGETVPGTAYIRKDAPRRFNLHLTELGGDFWVDHLLFRDYMRAHPEVALEYERLKRELMARYARTPRSYNDGKAGFIKSVVAKARSEFAAIRYDSAEPSDNPETSPSDSSA